MMGSTATGAVASERTGLWSPFGGAYERADERDPARVDPGALESPFGSALAGEAFDRGDEAAAELLDLVQDEDFNDALEQLVDEAAARSLAEHGTWTATPPATEVRAALDEWIEPLAEASERALDTLGERLSGTDVQTLTEAELQALVDAAAAPQIGPEAFDQFLGGLIKKAGGLVKGAVALAEKGVAVAGRFLPTAILLKKLGGLIRPLLRKVLAVAMNRLPPSVRPIASTLARKLNLGEAPESEVELLAESFDVEVSALLLAPDTLEELAVPAESSAAGGVDRVAGLDEARAQLAWQLTDRSDATPPVAEIEQFLPAVLAARPLIKLVLSVLGGRDRVVAFIAARIAGLIKGIVGADAAKALSPPVADVGLRLLGLEAPADREDGLAGEAIAATVEGTVDRLLDQPLEAFGSELQLDAAVQQAFAESAAAYLPDRLLRPELPERETAGTGGIWVLMPRAARPHYRFRRYTRTFPVPVSRQVARCVPWSDGGTLETHLLDRGAQRWPVQAEVDLYEALPGTHVGHFTLDEAVGGSRPDAGEYELLTPDIAGLLLGEPALGRPAPAGTRGAAGRPRPTPGSRYFRIRAGGLTRRRRRRRAVIRLDVASGQVRVLLRLSERQAQQVLSQLDRAPGRQRDLPSVLLAIRQNYDRTLAAGLAARLVKRNLVVDTEQARAVADRMTAAVGAALSAYLEKSAAQLAAAVRDPADGVTLVVTFAGLTRERLASDLPPATGRGPTRMAQSWLTSGPRTARRSRRTCGTGAGPPSRSPTSTPRRRRRRGRRSSRISGSACARASTRSRCASWPLPTASPQPLPPPSVRLT